MRLSKAGCAGLVRGSELQGRVNRGTEKVTQSCVRAVFAEHRLLTPAYLGLSPEVAWAAFQPSGAQLCFLDWPGEFLLGLPSATVLEKFPGHPTSSLEEVRAEGHSLYLVARPSSQVGWGPGQGWK